MAGRRIGTTIESQPIHSGAPTMNPKFRPTPSLVISLMALFVALSAGAYAVGNKAPKDSVVSKSIRNGKVKSADLKDGAVTGTDVRDDSLTGADVDESTLALPSSAAPAGAAGGDLTGLYPDPQIADGAIDSPAIADNGVGAVDLAADSVFNSELAGNSVGSSNIVDGTVSSAELGVNAVDEDEIKANAVHSDELAVGAVTGAKVSDNSISGSDIQLSPNVATGDTGSNAGYPKELEVSCTGGRTAISAGAAFYGTRYPILPALSALERVDDDTWRAEAIETDPDSDTNWGLRMQVFCMHL
jgi:hypothetical protein